MTATDHGRTRLLPPCAQKPAQATGSSKDHPAMNAIIRALASAASLAVAAATVPAVACPKDYTFEPVKVDVKNGRGSELAVRITHTPTGKPVEGAVLFRTRLDMS